MKVKLIREAVIDGVLKAAGTEMEVDKARQLEFAVLGIIEVEKEQIRKAVKKPAEKRTTKRKYK
jgi:hypothetical protein